LQAKEYAICAARCYLWSCSNRPVPTPLLAGQAARDPSARLNLRDAIQKIVYDLHYTRRHNLLVALFDLILMYESDANFPDAMVSKSALNSSPAPRRRRGRRED
jgi:hypothetical protein